MNKKLIILIMVLVLFIGGLGVGGFFFYNYILDKNATEQLTECFCNNVRTDVSSFAGSYKVLRGDTGVDAFTKQDALVFANVINSSVSSYMNGENIEIIRNLDEITKQTTDACQRQLLSLNTQLTEDEIYAFDIAVNAIVINDVYKTLVSQRSVSSSEYQSISSYSGSLLEYFKEEATMAQNEVTSNIDSLSTFIDNLNVESTDADLSTLEGLCQKVQYVDTFYEYSNKSSTEEDESLIDEGIDDEPTSEATTEIEKKDTESPISSDNEGAKVENSTDNSEATTTVVSSPLIVLLPLSDIEVNYLTAKITDCKEYLNSESDSLSEYITVSEYNGIFNNALDQLRSDKAISPDTENSIRIMIPNLKAIISDTSVKQISAISSRVDDLSTYENNLKDALIKCNVANANLLSLSRIMRFGLDKSSWSNESMVALCENAINDTVINAIITDYELKAQTKRVKRFIDTFDTFDLETKEGINTVADTNLKKSVDALLEVSSLDSVSEENLSSLKTALFGVTDLGFDETTALFSSIEDYKDALIEKSSAKKKAAIKAANAKIDAASKEFNSNVFALECKLYEHIADLENENIKDSDELIEAKDRLLTSFTTLSGGLDVINEQAQSIADELSQNATSDYSEYSEAFDESLNALSSLEIELGALSTGYEKVKELKTKLSSLSKSMEYADGSSYEKITSETYEIIDLIKELRDDENLSRTHINMLNSKLTSLTDGIDALDKVYGTKEEVVDEDPEVKKDSKKKEDKKSAKKDNKSATDDTEDSEEESAESKESENYKPLKGAVDDVLLIINDVSDEYKTLYETKSKEVTDKESELKNIKETLLSGGN